MPLVMSTRPRSLTTRLLGVVAAAALLVSACGSSSSGGISGAGHDSPEGAVKGFAGALQGWDGSAGGLDGVLEWVDPSQRSQARAGLGLISGSGGAFKLSYRFKDFDTAGSTTTDATHAVVKVKGSVTICGSGTIAGQSFNTCQPQALTPSGTQDTIRCIRVSDRWYVADFGTGTGAEGAATPGSTAGSTGSTPAGPTPAGGPPSPGSGYSSST